MFVGIIHARHEAVLIVYVRGECYTIDDSDFVGFCGECRRYSSKESAFLLLEFHCVEIFRLSIIPGLISRPCVNENKFCVWVVLCNFNYPGELEAHAHKRVVICRDILNDFHTFGRVASCLLYR